MNEEPLLDRISTNPKIFRGKAIIRGRRLALHHPLACWRLGVRRRRSSKVTRGGGSPNARVCAINDETYAIVFTQITIESPRDRIEKALKKRVDKAFSMKPMNPHRASYLYLRQILLDSLDQFAETRSRVSFFAILTAANGVVDQAKKLLPSSKATEGVSDARSALDEWFQTGTPYQLIRNCMVHGPGKSQAALLQTGSPLPMHFSSQRQDDTINNVLRILTPIIGRFFRTIRLPDGRVIPRRQKYVELPDGTLVRVLAGITVPLPFRSKSFS